MADRGSRLHRTYLSQSDPVPEIVNSLAEVENTPPSELLTELGPLYNYIDPTALETLLARSEDVLISFVVESYRLEIDGDELTIYEN